MAYLDLEKKARTKRAWALKNRERINELRRASHLLHPEVRHALNHVQYLKHRSKRVTRDRSNRYGFTEIQFQTLLLTQCGKCAICGIVLDSTQVIHIDHNHSCCSGSRSCGRCVRGILCASCNRGLGQFKDASEILVAASDYLREAA